MEKDFNTFQWSCFLNGKEEQVVVRGNDWKQFVLDVEAVKKQFLNETTKVVSTSTTPLSSVTVSTSEPIEPKETREDWCTIHDKEMKLRKGKYGEFYSHYVGTYPNGTWCNGTKNENSG